MKHRCADRNAASPKTNDMVHHGIAKSQSPVADSSSAGINQRRSLTMGCANAATVSSNAINALNGGCRIQCPVSSIPGGERTAITVK
jgi:hypothetical protein